MKRMKGREQLRKVSVIAAFALVIVAAVASHSAVAASQSYNVLNNNAQPGMLMSLSANAGVVEPATDKNASLLLGVVTTSAAYNQQAGQVSLENEGQLSTLVSTLGGDIRFGDRIAPSSIAGIGAKVRSSGWIVGIAQANLDAKTKGAIATTVSDATGGKHTVYVARIPLIVHVTYYNVASASPASPIPANVQVVANAIAGKHVSVLGLVLSFLLLLIGVTMAGVLVNSTVRSTFSAIARQPLSKAAVLRMMMRSFAIAGAIVIVVLVGALLLLRIL